MIRFFYLAVIIQPIWSKMWAPRWFEKKQSHCLTWRKEGTEDALRRIGALAILSDDLKSDSCEWREIRSSSNRRNRPFSSSRSASSSSIRDRRRAIAACQRTSRRLKSERDSRSYSWDQKGTMNGKINRQNKPTWESKYRYVKSCEPKVVCHEKD